MNYKQTEGAAALWRRASQVSISNPLNGAPQIAFQEEDALSMNGATVAVPGMPSTVIGKFNPASVIPLISPETGEALGSTATHLDLYVILHSLYIQLALERDGRDAAAANPQAPGMIPS